MMSEIYLQQLEKMECDQGYRFKKSGLKMISAEASATSLPTLSAPRIPFSKIEIKGWPEITERCTSEKASLQMMTI